MLSVTCVSQESKNYAVLNSGDTVYYKVREGVNPRFTVAPASFYNAYYKNGKKAKFKEKDIVFAKFGSSIHLSITKANGKTRLFEIIAFNEKCFISRYYENNTKLILFDRVNKKIITQSLLFMRAKYDSKALDKINNKIAPHFKDCPDLIDMLKANIKEKVHIDSGIFYYNCGDTSDMIETVIK